MFLKRKKTIGRYMNFKQESGNHDPTMIDERAFASIRGLNNRIEKQNILRSRANDEIH